MAGGLVSSGMIDTSSPTIRWLGGSEAAASSS